jgi:hypothetical protein
LFPHYKLSYLSFSSYDIYIYINLLQDNKAVKLQRRHEAQSNQELPRLQHY